MESPLKVANFFIKKALDVGDELTPMKLVKLVYISHGWYLALKDEPLLDEGVQAWHYGPVVPTVYHAVKEWDNKPVTKIISPAVNPNLHSLEFANGFKSDLLAKIWEEYGKFNGLQLSTLTHRKGTPWDITWNDRGGKNRSSVVIPNNLIKEHYKAKMNATNPAATAAK